jgi:CHAT domain-containing protein
VAHFACHGSVNPVDPAASGLILYDHQTTPLTVADISGRRLTGSLAYLSACDTTVTSPALANEAVHITGAFHLAGYGHVIGTLWPINDIMASQIATHFYSELTHHGTTSPDTSRAAVAIHDAARRLRERYPAVPILWAGYTHTGI